MRNPITEFALFHPARRSVLCGFISHFYSDYIIYQRTHDTRQY